MNASGDRRYRRCRGLSDSFGKVKGESAQVLIRGLVSSVDDIDGELEKYEVTIDSRREKNDSDWLGTLSDDKEFEESEQNGRGEAGCCLTRMMLVRIVLRAARRVPKSVKKNPKGVK